MAELTDRQLLKLYFCKRDDFGRPVDPRAGNITPAARRPMTQAQAKARFLRAMLAAPGVTPAMAQRAWEAHLAKKKAKREGKAVP